MHNLGAAGADADNCDDWTRTFLSGKFDGTFFLSVAESHVHLPRDWFRSRLHSPLKLESEHQNHPQGLARRFPMARIQAPLTSTVIPIIGHWNFIYCTYSVHNARPGTFTPPRFAIGVPHYSVP